MNELSHGFGLKDTAKGSTSLYHIIQHIFNNQKDIKIYVFFTFACGTLILCYLLITKPRVPWHAVAFLVCIVVGIISKESQFHPLGEAWTSDGDFKKSIANQYKKRINEHFKHAEILLNPYFMINCITLTMVTILEGSITMKLSELIMVKKINKQLEFVGLALSNFLAGVFGILPMSIPIGRNLLALRSGASHRIYLLISAFFVVLFGFIIWPYMKSLPMITVSVFNASLGVLLIDTELFHNYWRFSPKYAIVFTLVILSCFFLDLAFCMIFSWLFFLVLYM